MSTKETAFKQFQNGELKEALESFKKVLANNDQDAETHHYIGALYHVLGQNDQAKDHLSKATTLKDNYATAIFDLGLVYLAQKDANSAYQNKVSLDSLDSSLAMDLAIRIKASHPDFKFETTNPIPLAQKAKEEDGKESHTSTVVQTTELKNEPKPSDSKHEEGYRPF